jgi:hypothetical protein
MHGRARRRVVILHSARSACHTVSRRALRSSLRRAPRRAPRHILKDNGPTLHDICALVSAYLRLSKAYDKKWHPPSRFKTLGTQEERDRRMLEDLERAYGENSPFIREQKTRTTASPSSSPVSPPLVPPDPPLAAPVPQPRPQCDVLSVPLVRLPNGLLSCDWSRARPA